MPTARRTSLIVHLLVFLAVFSLAAAALLPFWVYPRLARLPDDPDAVQSLRGTGIRMLVVDLGSSTGARLVPDATVTSVTRVIGTSGESWGRPEAVVWRLATRTDVAGVGLSDARIEVVSLDRRTALPVNCCGDRLLTVQGDETGRPLVHAGLVAWPFDVRPDRTYQVWDVVTGQPRPAQFVAEEQHRGLRVYRFVSELRDRKVGTQALPGGLLGLPDASVDADDIYSVRQTFWIEPASGAVVDLTQELDRRFVHAGRSVSSFTGTLALEEPPPGDPTAAGIRTGAVLLPWLRGRASWVLLGAALLAGGAAARIRLRAVRQERQGELRRLYRFEPQPHPRHQARPDADPVRAPDAEPDGSPADRHVTPAG